MPSIAGLSTIISNGFRGPISEAAGSKMLTFHYSLLLLTCVCERCQLTLSWCVQRLFRNLVHPRFCLVYHLSPQQLTILYCWTNANLQSIASKCLDCRFRSSVASGGGCVCWSKTTMSTSAEQHQSSSFKWVTDHWHWNLFCRSSTNFYVLRFFIWVTISNTIQLWNR